MRNPALLGDVSPETAEEAVREALPGVADDIIQMTADALAESDVTREALAKDKEAADLLADFKEVWAGHCVDVVSGLRTTAAAAQKALRHQEKLVDTRKREAADADTQARLSEQAWREAEGAAASAEAELRALESREEYKEAGRLKDLRATAEAQASTADALATSLRSRARAVSASSSTSRAALMALTEDIRESLDAAFEAVPALKTAAPVTWSEQPRARIQLAKEEIDPGVRIVIHGTTQGLRALATRFMEEATTSDEEARAAELAIKDNEKLNPLRKTVDDAQARQRLRQTEFERAAAEAKTAEAETGISSRALLDAVRAWATENHEVLAVPTTDERLERWNSGDVDALRQSEASQVLARLEQWERFARHCCDILAAGFRAKAARAEEERQSALTQAVEKRERASGLRTGKLVPQPRPAWAGEGDDGRAFGSVVEWRAAFAEVDAQARVEAALSASGLLAAALSSDGVVTDRWAALARGPVAARSLAEILTVDSAHPLSAAAYAVLERVSLAESAVTNSEEPQGLTIGLDGTFSAGVLVGHGVGEQLSPPAYIGARKRREAALRLAEELDKEAKKLEQSAARLSELAVEQLERADAESVRAALFPSSTELRQREARRIERASAARRLGDDAAKAASEAKELEEKLRHELDEWTSRTRARGLPPDIVVLRDLAATAAARGQQLRRAAEPLAKKLSVRLQQILAAIDTDVDAELAKLAFAAQLALRTAQDSAAAVRMIEETSGTAIREILERHGKLKQESATLRADVGPKHTAMVQGAAAAAGAQASYEAEAGEPLTKVKVAQEQALGALSQLLLIPGVAEAVLGSEQVMDGASMLKQLERALSERKPSSRRTLQERYDALRSKLASTAWTIEFGEHHPALQTYVLGHRETSFTPMTAAAHAAVQRAAAEKAYKDTEEKALRDFVIGRVPTAIGTAWTELKGWVDTANRKMRVAAASSGVTVQLRAPAIKELPPHVQVVHDLACEIADVDRTAEQREQLSAALIALIGAAEGETMHDRLRNAVDVRAWVDVYYEVTHPGEKPRRWTPKTGLSGGERRLVVLAPMLAALSAVYDRLGDHALRLVALDEIPAEVDPKGREGLARYLAELDLDLICTSHHWDGCPGAWDGIDAFDMEAGPPPDKTVVAFPMLIRGARALPGDGARIEPS